MVESLPRENRRRTGKERRGVCLTAATWASGWESEAAGLLYPRLVLLSNHLRQSTYTPPCPSYCSFLLRTPTETEGMIFFKILRDCNTVSTQHLLLPSRILRLASYKVKEKTFWENWLHSSLELLKTCFFLWTALNTGNLMRLRDQSRGANMYVLPLKIYKASQDLWL